MSALGGVVQLKSITIAEWPVGRLHWSAFSSQRGCVWQLTRFSGRKWKSGLNMIGHPDWVKLSVESNCAPSQNTKFFPSVLTNGPGDLGSIPGQVIPKTQKMVLDASLLNTQHYKVRIKGKVEQSREGVAPSLTPWCSSYRKGSLRVTLDYGRQLLLLQYINFIK